MGGREQDSGFRVQVSGKNTVYGLRKEKQGFRVRVSGFRGFEQFLGCSSCYSAGCGVEEAADQAAGEGDTFGQVDESAVAGFGGQASTDGFVEFDEHSAGDLRDGALRQFLADFDSSGFQQLVGGISGQAQQNECSYSVVSQVVTVYSGNCAGHSCLEDP